MGEQIEPARFFGSRPAAPEISTRAPSASRCNVLVRIKFSSLLYQVLTVGQVVFTASIVCVPLSFSKILCIGWLLYEKMLFNEIKHLVNRTGGFFEKIAT